MYDSSSSAFTVTSHEHLTDLILQDIKNNRIRIFHNYSFVFSYATHIKSKNNTAVATVIITMLSREYGGGGSLRIPGQYAVFLLSLCTDTCAVGSLFYTSCNLGLMRKLAASFVIDFWLCYLTFLPIFIYRFGKI